MKIQQNMDVQNSLMIYQAGVRSASKSNNKNMNTANPVGTSLTWMVKGKNSLMSGKSAASNPLSRYTDKTPEEKSGVSLQMRQMIRGLQQEPVAGNSNNNGPNGQTNGFPGLTGAQDAEEENEIKTSEKYNYKTVANKIQQAKTSLSAGQAVLAAKRETLKIRRMISAGNGDAEELQIALTHAKRMEMVARKKKHHLELEELVAHTRKMDEKSDKMEEAAAQMKNALVAAEEEKVTEKEDEIFEAREEMLDKALEELQVNEKSQPDDGMNELQEGKMTLSEDEMKALNEMISEFGEEELEELEKTMEMLETMEVVDPHMSKEDFEELKRKHRASEDKAIVKANMEYLKDMIKHELEKGASMPGMNGGNMSSAGFSLPLSAGASMPTANITDAPAIDIQV